MRKRVIALFLAVIMFGMSAFVTDINANAETISEDVDYSFLLTDDALISYAVLQTRGVYLMSGHSIINDAGDGKIGAGGVTNAAISCKVSVSAIIERKTSTGWARVTSWTVTNQNALTAIASRYIYVASGYWYRCRCTHYAGTDVSTSCTSSLWM